MPLKSSTITGLFDTVKKVTFFKDEHLNTELPK